MFKVVIIIVIVLIIIVCLIGCSSKTPDEPDLDDGDEVIDGDGVIDVPVNTGELMITGADARKLFEADDQVVLLDVRNQDEYDEYHILDSILIPVDELESRLSELPDKNANIIVYCRAGRRSAVAVEILLAHGFTNVHDMQSVNNW